MSEITCYKPIQARADSLPYGYMLVDGEPRWIFGSRTLSSGKVLVLVDHPTNVLGEVFRYNPADQVTVHVPTTLNDLDVWVNVASALVAEGVDLDNPGNQ